LAASGRGRAGLLETGPLKDGAEQITHPDHYGTRVPRAVAALAVLLLASFQPARAADDTFNPAVAYSFAGKNNSAFNQSAALGIARFVDHDGVEITEFNTNMAMTAATGAMERGVEALLEQGANVVFAAAGSTGAGIFDAAVDHGTLAIGVDTNENGARPGHILMSMLKRVDIAVYRSLVHAQRGEWKPGIKTLGLAALGVDAATLEGLIEARRVLDGNLNTLGMAVSRMIEAQKSLSTATSDAAGLCSTVLAPPQPGNSDWVMAVNRACRNLLSGMAFVEPALVNQARKQVSLDIAAADAAGVMPLPDRAAPYQDLRDMAVGVNPLLTRRLNELSLPRPRARSWPT